MSQFARLNFRFVHLTLDPNLPYRSICSRLIIAIIMGTMFSRFFPTTCKRKPSPKNESILYASFDLWDLVLDRTWDKVVAHAQKYPIDAEWQDDNHETPLYLACQLQASSDVIQTLLDAYTPAASILARHNRDAPIHIACRYRVDASVLRVLLDQQPELALQHTRWGKTPLSILEEFDTDDDDGSFWERAKVILTAVARHREGLDNQQSQYHVLHAAVYIGRLSRCCPKKVLSYILQNHPSAARDRDTLGYVPLHLAIATRSHEGSNRDQKMTMFLIQSLIDACPEAAQIQDDHGQYPLHRALGMLDCDPSIIANLIHAAPNVLLLLDPTTRLPPFLLAAATTETTAEEQSRELNLNTIYLLLRSNPTALLLVKDQPQ